MKLTASLETLRAFFKGPVRIYHDLQFCVFMGFLCVQMRVSGSAFVSCASSEPPLSALEMFAFLN